MCFPKNIKKIFILMLAALYSDGVVSGARYSSPSLGDMVVEVGQCKIPTKNNINNVLMIHSHEIHLAESFSLHVLSFDDEGGYAFMHSDMREVYIKSYSDEAPIATYSELHGLVVAVLEQKAPSSKVGLVFSKGKNIVRNSSSSYIHIEVNNELESTSRLFFPLGDSNDNYFVLSFIPSIGCDLTVRK